MCPQRLSNFPVYFLLPSGSLAGQEFLPSRPVRVAPGQQLRFVTDVPLGRLGASQARGHQSTQCEAGMITSQ